MPSKDNSKNTSHDGEHASVPESASRRALLKGSVKAMPVVLTLQSGAALARSSNLIGVAAPGTRDLDGNTLCLDTSTAEESIEGKYDLDDPASGTVNVIPDELFFDEPDRSEDPESADEMCEEGGVYYYHQMGWREVRLPEGGVVVSATALVSVSARGDILINRIA